LDGDLDSGAANRERVDERTDVLRHDVRRCDLDPAGLAGRVVDRAACLFGEAEDLTRERGEAAAAGGPRDAAALPDEELIPEFLAECADGDRDRGLGDLELGRGRFDRPEPRNQHEGLKLGKSHAAGTLKGSLNTA